MTDPSTEADAACGGGSDVERAALAGDVWEVLQATEGLRRKRSNVIADQWHYPDRDGLFDDITQETALALIRAGFGRCESEQSISAWVTAIQRNLSIRMLLKWSRGPRLPLEGAAAQPADQWQDPEGLQSMRLKWVHLCIEKLREPWRTTVIRSYFNEETAQEIGRTDGITTDGVRARIRKAQQQIERCVERKSRE